MDTQTKIELSVGVESHFTIDINNTIIQTTAFHFYEYQRVKLKFISDNEYDYLQVESYYDDNKRIEIPENGMIKLYPGDEIVISPGGDNEDMLVPGDYHLKVFKNNRIYESIYRVSPSNMNTESINIIREYLEKKLNGLSYNVYKQRNANTDNSQNQINLNICKYLNEECKKLFSHMNMIINNPITDIQKRYGVKSCSKRADSKSQRWLNSKGMRYANELEYTKYYEKHTFVTHDVLENSIIKNTLVYIYNLIIDINKNYLREINSIDEVITKLNEKAKKLELYNSTLKNKIGYDRTYWNVERDIKSIKSNIDIEYKKIEVVNQYLSITSKIKNQLNHYLNETWIKDVSVIKTKSIVTHKLFKNKSYMEILELYNRLKKIKENDQGSKYIENKQCFVHKRTSNLFEIYIFLLIKDIFEELGFKWTDGWLKDIKDIESLVNINLEQGEAITLIKDNYKVVMNYDKLIKRDLEAKKSKKSQVVSSFVTNRRPDVLIDIYKDGEFIKSLIVEVKYRRKSYIYSEDANTDVMYQLLAYRNFVYYDSEIDKISMRYIKPIDKVMAIYVSDDEVFNHDMYDDVKFIGINPLNIQDKSTGYEEIKNDIIDALN
ncbi:MAG: nuclease domain-containing protein [Romboutsia sp.]